MALSDEPDRATDQGEDLRNLGRGSSLKIIGAGCNTVLTLALIVIVTRGYGQEEAGVFFATTTLFMLIGQASEIGAEEAMLRFVPVFRATGRRGDVRRLLRRGLAPVVVASTAASAVTFVFAPLLGSALSGSSDTHAVTTLVRLIVPFIPLVAVSEVVLAATRGYHTMRPSVVIYDVTLSGAQAGLALVAWACLGHGLIPLVLSYVLPYLAVVSWSLAALWRLSAEDRQLAPSGAGPVEGYWRFTVPRAAARICQYALRRIDVVLVAILAGPKEAAIYTALSRFITVGSVGVQAVQQVAQPKMGELLHLDDRVRAQQVFRTTTVWLMVGSWPIYIVIGVFSTVLLRVFGHGYARGGLALSLLCASQLVTVATGPVDIALVMSGRSGLSLVNQLGSLAVDVAACVLLVPHLGVAGAAAAKALALLFSNLVAAFQVHRSIGLQPFGPAFATVAITALLGVGGVGLAVRALLGADLPALVLGGVLGGAIYSLTCFARRKTLLLDALARSLRQMPENTATS